nr:hypothetical protein [Opitutaceae bacterium]
MKKSFLARALFFFACATAAFADVSLPASYGSHMVLQRDVPIRLRGWADPGEAVTVTHGDAVVRTTAAPDRRWAVELPARPAGEIPDLIVQGKNKFVLGDLLAGDVWLCSGQSNMEFKLPRAEGGAEAVAAATHPRIRLFGVGRKVAGTPQDDVRGEWTA